MYNRQEDWLKMAFSSQRWICLTADIWSSKNRCFLVVNGHFLDETTLKRRSYALCCEHCPTPHNNETIAERFQLLYNKYGIKPSNIVSTITDSGSGFLEPFRVFGQQACEPNEYCDNSSNAARARQNLSETDENSESCDEDEGESLLQMMNSAKAENETGIHHDNLVEFFQARIQNTKMNDEIMLALSNHEKCVAHQLHLIGSADSLQANTHKSYYRLYKGAFEKLDKLWECCGNPNSSEIILKYIGRNINRPAKTSWTSTFDKVNMVLFEV